MLCPIKSILHEKQNQKAKSKQKEPAERAYWAKRKLLQPNIIRFCSHSGFQKWFSGSPYIDQAALKKRLQKLLRRRSQISLSEVVALHPIEKGLSELVAWLNIATTREKDQKAVIDAQQSEVIPYTKDGKEFQVKMPQTVFLA